MACASQCLARADVAASVRPASAFFLLLNFSVFIPFSCLLFPTEPQNRELLAERDRLKKLREDFEYNLQVRHQTGA